MCLLIICSSNMINNSIHYTIIKPWKYYLQSCPLLNQKLFRNLWWSIFISNIFLKVTYILEYRIYLGCYLLSMHPMYVPISTSHKIFKLRTACNIATISIVPMPYIIEEFFWQDNNSMSGKKANNFVSIIQNWFSYLRSFCMYQMKRF